MTNRNVAEGEVYLNGTRFRLANGGRVRSSLDATYPDKVVIGDFTKDSQRNVSLAGWSRWTGGIGRERMEPNENDRAWWSTCHLWHPRHLVKSPLVTQTAAPNTAGEPLISELDGSIVAAFGQSVEDYNSGGDSWTARATLTASPTDVINVNLPEDATENLVFAYTSGYHYSSAIATWNTSTKNVVKMAFWDERLWGIDAVGQLWYTYTVGSGEINDALLPLSHNDSVTGLFEGRGPDRARTLLYATTKKYVYQHDYGNRTWLRLGIRLPANLGASDFSRQAEVWQEDVFLGANAGVVRYIPGAEAAVQPMLLGHDDGLKKTREGRVRCMASSVAGLLIGTTPINTSDTAVILQWNNQTGYQVLYEAPAANQQIQSMHVSDAVTNYRLWIGYNGRVYWMRLHDSVANPKQVEGWQYSSTTDRHELPWFTADQEFLVKTILRVRVQTSDCNTSETVTVYYGSDYNETWTQFDQTHSTEVTFDATDNRIEGDGVTTFTLATEASATGSAVRAYRLRFDLDRGSTAENSPDVNSVWLEFIKVLDEKFRAIMDINLMDPANAKSPMELRADLVTAVASDTLVEFTYRDDDGNDRNYFVKVYFSEGDEETGYNEAGIQRIRVEVP